jgi:DNA polymerase III delta prime subunit
MKTAIKYAPRDLKEMIYPSQAAAIRIDAYASGGLGGHILLFGPNGTGKTTVANLLVQAIGGPNAHLEGKHFDELLGMPKLGDHMQRGCAAARFISGGKYHLIFNEFDEAKKNVSQFWTALDACGESAMVIITTNNLMRISQSIRSRCDLIEFAGVSASSALNRIQYILRAEGLTLPDAQVLHYLKQDGHLADLRKYFKKADELLFLHSNGFPLPSWTVNKPALKLAKSSNS